MTWRCCGETFEKWDDAKTHVYDVHPKKLDHHLWSAHYDFMEKCLDEVTKGMVVE